MFRVNIYDFCSRHYGDCGTAEGDKWQKGLSRFGVIKIFHYQ